MGEEGGGQWKKQNSLKQFYWVDTNFLKVRMQKDSSRKNIFKLYFFCSSSLIYSFFLWKPSFNFFQRKEGVPHTRSGNFISLCLCFLTFFWSCKLIETHKYLFDRKGNQHLCIVSLYDVRSIHLVYFFGKVETRAKRRTKNPNNP